MAEESGMVLGSGRSVSRSTGMRFSGLIARNSGGGENGLTCSSLYSAPFSASTTRTLRTKGETFAP